MKHQLHEEKQTAFLWLRSRQGVEDFLQNPLGYEYFQPAFLENDPQQALFAKMAPKAWAFLGALLEGLATASLSLPFATIHPSAPWEYFKPRRRIR